MEAHLFLTSRVSGRIFVQICVEDGIVEAGLYQMLL